MTLRSRYRSIRAVYFDAVGTLLIPQPSAPVVYAQVAEKYGLDSDPERIFQRFCDAYEREEAADRNADWATSEARELVRWQSIVSAALPGGSPELFDELFNHFGTAAAWATPVGTAELVRRLVDIGLTLGVGSNYDSRLNTVVAGIQELALLRQRVVISALVNVRKPHPAFFQTISEQANCPAEQILFVGDDLQNDYLGAKSAGMQALLIDVKRRHLDIRDRVDSFAELSATLLE